MMTLEVIPTARYAASNNLPLPEGVILQPLATHSDARGSFTELFRGEWGLRVDPVQWNLVRSAANVLRGVHVHREHKDYLTVVEGEMVLGLHDTRPAVRTRALSVMLRLQAGDLHSVAIPCGVAHGFYFAEPGCHVYAVDRYFDGRDDLGCRWDEPALGFAWPCHAPCISPRDQAAGSYSAMVSALGL